MVLEEVLKVESNNLLLNVTMHGGSLAAVVAFFYKDLISLWKNQKLLINLIIATIPVVITGGVLSYLGWINNIMNLAVVGYSTIFFGLLLFISDKKKEMQSFTNSISNKDAMIIGLYQILALIPGTSRSGITITAARF